MAEITEERISQAIQTGENAFWAAIASEFPEAKTGDLAPDTVFMLTGAMEKATRAWIDANISNSE
jgi:hypothetical protein